SDSSWHSLVNDISNKQVYPQSKHWHSAFDGRWLGSCFSTIDKSSSANPEWTLPRDSKHNIGTQKLPIIEVADGDFNGFANYSTARPLVVVSDSNYHDPEEWKVGYPNHKDAEGLRLLYKTYANNQGFNQVDSLKH